MCLAVGGVLANTPRMQRVSGANGFGLTLRRLFSVPIHAFAQASGTISRSRGTRPAASSSSSLTARQTATSRIWRRFVFEVLSCQLIRLRACGVVLHARGSCCLVRAGDQPAGARAAHVRRNPRRRKGKLFRTCGRCACSAFTYCTSWGCDSRRSSLGTWTNWSSSTTCSRRLQTPARNHVFRSCADRGRSCLSF